jgi:hypothetical protein
MAFNGSPAMELGRDLTGLSITIIPPKEDWVERPVSALSAGRSGRDH